MSNRETAQNEKVWECGLENISDVTARLSETTLIISGKGKMRDYDYNDLAPWYGENIVKIMVRDGVINIGNYAFYKCLGVTNVDIADSVIEIRYRAFYYCTALISFPIPNSIRDIGDMVFGNCVSLSSITIPESIRTLGSHIFIGCKSLVSITNLSQTPQNIEYETFDGEKIDKHFREKLASRLILYVPIGVRHKYIMAPVWNSFSKILPIPKEQPEPDEELTSEQLEKKIINLEKEISDLTKEKENLIIKKLCMSGLEGNPKDVAEFMSLFNQRDGLKYLTHDFDESSGFEIDDFMTQIRDVLSEQLVEKNIPKSLSDLLSQFTIEENPKWIGFDKEFNPREITTGWSTLDWQDNPLHPIRDAKFAEIIRDFKRTIRIESNLETFMGKIFDDKSFELYSSTDLSKADFYTHVGEFASALMTIFEEIKQRGDSEDKKSVNIDYTRERVGDYLLRNIIITHNNSYPARDDENLITEWLGLEKGNMGKIASHLKGYCHWSVITKIGEKPIKVNILREEGTQEWEDIDASEVKGFTHILTFYSYSV